MRLFFRNDYGQGCIPEILELLQKANDESCPGYGTDDYCAQAKALLKSHMPDFDSDIHFLVGGTLVNMTMIRHVLRPWEGVISADTGHIAVHETGAVEFAGHKILTVPNSAGKVTPAMVSKCWDTQMVTYEHMVYPKAVYISNATELGTVYSRKELEELSAICKEKDLYLLMDGARLGAALCANVDYDLNDLCKWCDAFTVGGTKNGALMGEALVLVNENLKPYFRFTEKQSGAMLAKGWLLGIQFIGLFENDAFYANAKHANNLAALIQDEAQELGYPLLMHSDTNQIFLEVTKEEYDALTDQVDFEIWEYYNEHIIIRFVTSWHTSLHEAQQLCQILADVKAAEEEEEEKEPA
jgi:threonine aldolase